MQVGDTFVLNCLGEDNYSPIMKVRPANVTRYGTLSRFLCPVSAHFLGLRLPCDLCSHMPAVANRRARLQLTAFWQPMWRLRGLAIICA